MPWTRLDDQFHTNPKLTGLPDPAFRMYVNGLVWSVANLTDGRIAYRNAVNMGLKQHGNSVRNTIRHLVETGLWAPDTDEKDVWWVHDFDQYQPTKAQVQQEREATRRRVQKHRDRRGNGVTDPLRNGVTEDDVTALVTPPHPIPKKISTSLSLTHTLTDTLNDPQDDEDDEAATQHDEDKDPTPPPNADPTLWTEATNRMHKQQAAGTNITHPRLYTEAIYTQLIADQQRHHRNLEQAAVVTHCPNCDNAGWITDTNGDVEIPTTRCTHLRAVEEA